MVRFILCVNGIRATMFHIAYECMDNDNILAPVLARSKKIFKQTMEEHVDVTFFWVGGILPKSNADERQLHLRCQGLAIRGI